MVSKTNKLSAGTTVLSVTSQNDRPATAVVTASGADTNKGNLIKGILFPEVLTFIFDEHLKVVIAILVLYGCFLFGLYMWFAGGGIYAWYHGIFVISGVFSPLLPASLVMGQTAASRRLKKYNINCIDLSRINLVGKVRVFCFDKTGTLTEEGLGFYGGQNVIENEEGAVVFEEEKRSFDENTKMMQLAMAGCHSVTRVKGELIGNPVDAEMFKSTRWDIEPADCDIKCAIDTLKPPTANQQEHHVHHIIKRFEFLHAKQSMSVAIIDAETKHVHVFVKGSFEKVHNMCQKQSLPQDFHDVTNKCAMQGLYTLAFGHRDIGKMENEQQLQDVVEQWTRDDFENDMQFLGLVMFKNELKADTTQAIACLKEGGVRPVMITGDNAMTACAIARQCGIIASHTIIQSAGVDVQHKENGQPRLILAEMKKHDSNVVWKDVDTGEVVQDIDRALWLAKEGQDAPIELAVSGKAFEHMYETREIQKYLEDTRIFARMTPDGKVQTVKMWMERTTVAMCGDGGNDCGALRAAHAGIALSDAEASIVSAFNSTDRGVMSCVNLLREGRAALATSIATFKYLVMYGQVIGMLHICQAYFYFIASQGIWMIMDALLAPFLMLTLTFAEPAAKLASITPTARLLGPQTMLSVIGQVVINFSFLGGVLGFLYRQSWFLCHEWQPIGGSLEKWWLLANNYEAEVLAILVLFQLLNSAAVFNFGSVFRRSWIRNTYFVIFWAALFTWCSVLTLTSNSVTKFFRINYAFEPVSNPTLNNNNILPVEFRWKLWSLCVANCLIGMLFEYIVVLGPVRRLAKKHFPLNRMWIKL